MTFNVIPYYYNSVYKITILENFVISYYSEEVYSITGNVINDSLRKYSSITIVYSCEDNNTNYNLSFNNGMDTGVQSFTIYLNSIEPLNTNNFSITNVTVRY